MPRPRLLEETVLHSMNVALGVSACGALGKLPENVIHVSSISIKLKYFRFPN